MKAWAFLLAGVFLGGTASAAVQADEVIVVKKNASQSTDAVYLFEDSSAAKRMGKSFSITAQLFGAGPARHNATGVSAGVFLSRNTMIVADFTQGGMQSSYGTYSNSVYEDKTRSFGLHLKSFFGNSFYTRIGIDHRTSQHSAQFLARDDSKYSHGWSFSGQSTAASLVLGNQWQWDTFTLGCDWIGLLRPFSWKVDSESITGYRYSFTEDEIKDHENLQLAIVSLHVLRFYLGASF